MEDVKQKVFDGFNRIDQGKWAKCIDHVINKVEKDFWDKDGLLDIEPVVINFELSDNDSSDDENWIYIYCSR